MSVERFANTINSNGLGYSNGVVADGNGDYVRYSDYAALKAELEGARAQLAERGGVAEAAMKLAEQAEHCVVGYSAKKPNISSAMHRLAEAASAVRETVSALASSERPDLVAQLDDLIIKHRAEVVAWFDARFPEAKHIPHPDRPSERAEIAHDGFTGDIIGHYVTREGKRGVVVQQDGTRVVHVYGEKWLPAAPSPALREEDR